MLRRWVIMLAAATVLPLIGCETTGQNAQIPSHTATQPAERYGRWAEQAERFNEIARQGDVDLVFLGDSITAGWAGNGQEVWAEYYAPRKAANFGIGGDRTEHVLWRIDHGNFDGIDPKLIVLMIGTNNSGTNTAQEIADGVTLIVQRLGDKLPQTKILILAIFPRGTVLDDPRLVVNKKVNKIIAGLAADSNVYFLDIGDELTDEDGMISTNIMPDHLHLSPHGYELWAEAMEPSIRRYLDGR